MHHNFLHVFAPPRAAGALFNLFFYATLSETAWVCHGSNLTTSVWKSEHNAICRTIKLCFPSHCLICPLKKSNFKYLNSHSASSCIQITSYLFLTLTNPCCCRPWALQLCGTALLRIDNSCLGLMSMEWDVLWTNCECHLQRRHAVPQFLWPQGAVCQD